MADRVKVRLEGGPCDGRNTTARVADFGPVAVACGGANYEPTSRKTATGRLIYVPKTKPVPGEPIPDPSVAKPMKAHNAWHGMLHGVFVEAPKQLRQSAHARHALRRIAHRRGLR